MRRDSRDLTNGVKREAGAANKTAPPGANSVHRLEQIGASELTARWRERASWLRPHDGGGAAYAYETAAAELEEWVFRQRNRLIRLTEATDLTGRHRRTLERETGRKLPNHGRKGRPLVRLGDVVDHFDAHRVARGKRGAYDAAADARFLLGDAGRGDL